jgi:hypothetical protein
MARIYATAAQYQTYSGQTPPADIDRLLTQASRLLDSRVLRSSWYDVDETTGMPTDSEVLAAFSDAACAQVEFWGEVGEDVDMSGPVEEVRIGSAQVRYNSGAGTNRVEATTIGQRVYDALEVLPRLKFTPVTTTQWVGGWW